MDVKKLLLIVALLVLSLSTYSQNSSQAEKAKYYIEGDYSVNLVNGQFEYKLENIVSKGITFENEDYKIGKEQDEFEVFYFDHANTDYPGGFEVG